MGVAIGAPVVDTLLLGAEGRRRQLHDFPVLGDVWARYADMPGKAHDLLITPTRERPAGEIAKLIATTRLGKEYQGTSRNVAYLQDLVVAQLTIRELALIVIPATRWWDRIQDEWGATSPDKATFSRWIGLELDDALRQGPLSGGGAAAEATSGLATLRNEDRHAARLGLMLGLLSVAAAAQPLGEEDTDRLLKPLSAAVERLGREAILREGASALRSIVERYGMFGKEQDGAWSGIIFQVSLNRDAEPAVAQSVAAIKADAARSLFSISCKSLSWAILDSGIDQDHPAFHDYEAFWKAQEKAAKAGTASNAAPAKFPNRIKATFDFRNIRAIMGFDDEGHDRLARDIEPTVGLTYDEIKERLTQIAADRKAGRRVDWSKVRPLIEQTAPATPTHPHGTHVAGILGAYWLNTPNGALPQRTDPVKMSGVCPDIGLYDFRVLGSKLRDSEFAVIAALQFIRYLNDQSGYSVIHGVNMSLSIQHNVRNYACGRTQVCIEAEGLVANRVVVVAAAGNRGFQEYRLADNSTFPSYAASSITDPGNAEGVITVGSTHRHWPHTYGVSFFSSRGPTGDGRMKPDLLAPGEKIESCIPGGRSDQMDGTSMAAPHVSGAAALLMARHQELRDRPDRVKKILCDNATSLDRERSFQGHGMVDVLRAIQSI